MCRRPAQAFSYPTLISQQRRDPGQPLRGLGIQDTKAFGPRPGVSAAFCSLYPPSCPGPGTGFLEQMSSIKTGQPHVWTNSDFPSCPGHPQPRPTSQQCLELEDTVRTTRTRGKGRERPCLDYGPSFPFPKLVHVRHLPHLSQSCPSHAKEGSAGSPFFPYPHIITLTRATSPSCLSSTGLSPPPCPL